MFENFYHLLLILSRL